MGAAARGGLGFNPPPGTGPRVAQPSTATARHFPTSVGDKLSQTRASTSGCRGHAPGVAATSRCTTRTTSAVYVLVDAARVMPQSRTGCLGRRASDPSGKTRHRRSRSDTSLRRPTRSGTLARPASAPTVATDPWGLPSWGGEEPDHVRRPGQRLARARLAGRTARERATWHESGRRRVAPVRCSARLGRRHSGGFRRLCSRCRTRRVEGQCQSRRKDPGDRPPPVWRLPRSTASAGWR